MPALAWRRSLQLFQEAALLHWLLHWLLHKARQSRF
jgi:hypothetical protein